jgi:hypothetical protein
MLIKRRKGKKICDYYLQYYLETKKYIINKKINTYLYAKNSNLKYKCIQ